MSQEHELKGRFWISSQGQYFAGKGRYELLLHIKETGSLSAAAKLMHMSYKAAWDSVKAMNNAAEEPLVKTSVGGKKGGGTMLTEAGLKFLETYKNYNNIFNNAINYMQSQSPSNENSIKKLEKPHFIYSTADNIISLKVSAIERKGSYTEVKLSGNSLELSLTLPHIPFISFADSIELSFNMAAVNLSHNFKEGYFKAKVSSIETLPLYNIISLDIEENLIIKARSDKSEPFEKGCNAYFYIDTNYAIITKY